MTLKPLAAAFALLTPTLLSQALYPSLSQAQDAPRSTATPAFKSAIPNIAGKSLIAVVVDYPAGAKSPSHRHAGSAFIYAHVISGAVRSQVDDQPVKVYKAGEGWSENPGAHHRVSENASATEPAKLLAVFVLDSSETALTTPDPK
jgi:quercetin dioxygenase-like cupin family protein